jgi:hypothetical protein
LRVGGVAVLVLALLVLDLPFAGIVALGAVAAAGAVILDRVAAPVDAGT